MSSSRSLSMHYHKSNSSLISLGILVVLLARDTIGQDFAFPGENKTVVLQRVKDLAAKSPSSSDGSRTAVPSEKCGDNMILDGSNSTTPFCECVRGYLYHPNLDKCYSAYMRGPCDEGHHLVLRANQTIAECAVNPCKTENEVLYKGRCYGLLLTEGPCPADLYLVISEATFEPACEKIRPVSYQFITAPMRPCAPGSRRAGRGLCRKVM